MYNLFVNYYIDKNEDRQKELDYCIMKNLAVFDNIFVMGKWEDLKKLGTSKKWKQVPIDTRPTFKDYFDLINIMAPDYNNVNIIANLDIIIPFETLQSASTYFVTTENRCLALTRWEGDNVWERVDSQDTWIFKGFVLNMPSLDFGLGKCGCDNSIAHHLEQAGYRILNPSRSLKTIHMHSSGVRNFLNEKGEQIESSVPPPYKILPPTL